MKDLLCKATILTVIATFIFAGCEEAAESENEIIGGFEANQSVTDFGAAEISTMCEGAAAKSAAMFDTFNATTNSSLSSVCVLSAVASSEGAQTDEAACTDSLPGCIDQMVTDYGLADLSGIKVEDCAAADWANCADVTVGQLDACLDDLEELLATATLSFDEVTCAWAVSVSQGEVLAKAAEIQAIAENADTASTMSAPASCLALENKCAGLSFTGTQEVVEEEEEEEEENTGDEIAD